VQSDGERYDYNQENFHLAEYMSTQAVLVITGHPSYEQKPLAKLTIFQCLLYYHLI